MGWEEALEIVISRRRHERYRELCDGSREDHADWRAMMVALANDDRLAEDVGRAAGFTGEDPASREDDELRGYVERHGCCG